MTWSLCKSTRTSYEKGSLRNNLVQEEEDNGANGSYILQVVYFKWSSLFQVASLPHSLVWYFKSYHYNWPFWHFMPKGEKILRRLYQNWRRKEEPKGERSRKMQDWRLDGVKVLEHIKHTSREGGGELINIWMFFAFVVDLIRLLALKYLNSNICMLMSC